MNKKNQIYAMLLGSYSGLFPFNSKCLGMLGGRSVEMDGWGGNEIEGK